MSKLLLYFSFLLLILTFTSCEKAKNDNLSTGYIDADYVYISAPSSDKIKDLYVKKGSLIKAGDKLFELESYKATAFLGANENLDMALQNYIADMKKGARPEDIKQWQCGAYAIKEMIILTKLLTEMYSFLSVKNAAADQYFWYARQLQYSFIAFSKVIEAHIDYMKLPERPDKIAAFEMADNAIKSMIPYNKYQLQETTQLSPCNALVFDIFYRKGELVQAGKPVIMLLPDDNLKVVFYVNASNIKKIKLGENVKVYFSEESKEFIPAQINYISPNVQYTDPLIYSLKHNDKLIYMVEAKFAPEDKLSLHPGEVVSVEF
ncbi:MAG: HlyD family efflux transporter periplasmic adaptor subunit [Lentisphaerota bacterium]